MMLNDDFDKKLFDYFKNDIEVPKKIRDGIWITNLKSTTKSTKILDFFNMKKVAIAAMCLITISSGVVFAKDISQFIKKIFNDNTGVDTAIQNNYIYSTPKTTYSSLENNKVEISDLIMDDYTLDLNMTINFDDYIDTTNIKSIKFHDLIIFDEKNNILYSSNKETSTKFCDERNINNSYNNIDEITINTSSSYFIKYAYKNTLVISLNLSASDEKFPLSNKIMVSFNTMELQKDNEDCEITGNWKTDFLIPQKFLNRQSIIYKAVNCNNKNVYMDSIKAEVYETGMNFEMTMYWGNYQEVYNRIEEMRKKNVLSSQLIKQEQSYVQNENGEKFYPSQSTSSDGGYSFNENGRLIKWETFNLTKFNMTDSLKVVLTTIDDEQIIIELQTN